MSQVLQVHQFGSISYQPCPIPKHSFDHSFNLGKIRQTDPTTPDTFCLAPTYSLPREMTPLIHGFPLSCGSLLFNPLKRFVQTHPCSFIPVQIKPHLDTARCHWKPILPSPLQGCFHWPIPAHTVCQGCGISPLTPLLPLLHNHHTMLPHPLPPWEGLPSTLLSRVRPLQTFRAQIPEVRLPPKQHNPNTTNTGKRNQSRSHRREHEVGGPWF